MAAKRTPKRIGVHEMYTQSNDHGEWSNVVYPGGLQIDTFHHRGRSAHLHPPGDYDRPIELPGLTQERAETVLRDHLVRHQRIRLEELIEELRRE